MDGLQWVFELVDQISGPAANANASLGRLAGGLHEATAAHNGLQAAAAGAARAIGQVNAAAGRARLPSGRFASAGAAGSSGGGDSPLFSILGAILGASGIGGGGRGGGGGLLWSILGRMGGGGGGGAMSAMAGAAGPAGLAVEGASAALGIFKSVLETAVEGVSVFAHAALSFGEEVVRAASEKQTLRMGLELMLGDKGLAKDTSQRIRQLADTTPFQQNDIATPARSLVGSGYGVDRAFDVINGLGDVAAINNFDPESLKRMSFVMSKMNSDGRLLLSTMTQLNRNSGGMLGRGKVFKELGEELGKTPKQIEQAMRAGKITADQGTQAILEVIRKNFSGGQLGGAMSRFGREINGLMSTMRDMFQTLVPEVDDSPGLRAMRGVMRSLVDGFMSQKSALTHAMGSLIDAIFGGAFGRLEDGNYDQVFRDIFRDIAAGAETVSGWIDAAFAGVEDFILGVLAGFITIRPVLGAAWDAFKASFGSGDWSITLATLGYAAGTFAAATLTLALALGQLAGYATQAFEAISSLFSLPGLSPGGSVSEGAGANAVVIGSRITEGLAAGIDGGAKNVADSLRGLVDTGLAVVTNGFQIHSPSRVMAALGGHVAGGFALGIDGGAGRVEASMGRLVAAPEARIGGGFSSGARAGAGISVRIGDIHVTGAHDPKETADAVRAEIVAELAIELERAAITMGFADA